MNIIYYYVPLKFIIKCIAVLFCIFIKRAFYIQKYCRLLDHIVLRPLIGILSMTANTYLHTVQCLRPSFHLCKKGYIFFIHRKTDLRVFFFYHGPCFLEEYCYNKYFFNFQHSVVNTHPTIILCQDQWYRCVCCIKFK